MARSMSFSERQGIRKSPLVQSESIDNLLRIGLWNVFYEQHRDLANRLGEWNPKRDSLSDFFYYYWKSLSWPIDSIPGSLSGALDKLKIVFLEDEWNLLYDFIEHVGNGPNDTIGKIFRVECNKVLEQNSSAFRFLGHQIAPIISDEEIESVSSALDDLPLSSGARMHLNAAIVLLSDRTNPDYRNSIKESISAVESLCQRISSNPKATLSDALKLLNKTNLLHPALQTAFDKLYGYTSDADGIRHGVLDESSLDQADARFMLVACSAFINYMLAKVNG